MLIDNSKLDVISGRKTVWFLVVLLFICINERSNASNDLDDTNSLKYSFRPISSVKEDVSTNGDKITRYHLLLSCNIPVYIFTSQCAGQAYEVLCNKTVLEIFNKNQLGSIFITNSIIPIDTDVCRLIVVNNQEMLFLTTNWRDYESELASFETNGQIKAVIHQMSYKYDLKREKFLPFKDLRSEEVYIQMNDGRVGVVSIPSPSRSDKSLRGTLPLNYRFTNSIIDQFFQQ